MKTDGTPSFATERTTEKQSHGSARAAVQRRSVARRRGPGRGVPPTH